MAAPHRTDVPEWAAPVTLGDDVIPPGSAEPRLSSSGFKQRLYSVDTYFRDSWEDLMRICGPEAAEVARQHAFLLLKPDAVVRRKLVDALNWLVSAGWDVVHVRPFRVNRWAVRAFWQYQWNTATRDRRDMADLYMSATDSLILVLRSVRARPLWACTELTRAKGGSDPRRCRPGQLRHELGTLNQQLNLVHSADEPVDLIREIGVCYPADERDEVYTALAGRPAARDTAFRLARDLESRQEPVDLSLATIVAQVLGRAPVGTDLRRHLTSGEPVSWPVLDRAVRTSGVELSVWERVVLGTSLLVPTLENVRPLVTDASAG